MTLQDQWLLQKERTLAWIRTGFALVALAVVQLNPARVARFPWLSYTSLFGFLFCSLIILYITTQEKPAARRIGFIATALDLLWISLIVYSTGGSATPFFVFYFFPVITASSRYGIKGGLNAAVVGIISYGFIRFNFEWEDYIGIDRFIIRSIYLLALAYTFGFLSEFEKKQNAKLLTLSKTAGEVAALEERRRITHELHDGLLQTLATHILRIETCRKYLLQSPHELDTELKSIENETRTAMKGIRAFLAGKETQILLPGMLIEKLKEDLKFLRDGLGLHVILETDPEDLNVPETVEQDLYYVLREGLMNIARHSHASRADIKLTQTEKEIRGAVKDDGVGFDLNRTGKEQGFGLSTMKARINRAGGELDIESSPGRGAKISFVLPVMAEAA